MKVLVCGGRNFVDKDFLFRVLDGHKHEITSLISGGAFGTDTLAVEWAKERKIPYAVFCANWEKSGNYP